MPRQGRALGVLRSLVPVVVLAAIWVAPSMAADQPDRLPDDYTDDGKPIWYPTVRPKPTTQWVAPWVAAAQPVDRLPDDYTADGKPVWYATVSPKPIQQSASPLAVAPAQPADRLPDDYTDDGKPIWYPTIVSPKPVQQWEAEVGGRYFLGSGQTRLQLFGLAPSSLLVSQLTYSNLTTNAGEIFGRVEHLSGFFLKGYVGISALNSGKLQDEDFPPITIPYSSTDSDQHGGQVKYATVDFGWDMRAENLRLGVFAGYLYFSEQLNAYGCTQTASNPAICVPPIPNTVLGITDDATWNAMRLGVVTQWRLAYGFSLTTEVAWLPVGILSASDYHWLRPDLIKPIPENGTAASQVQLEALLNYQFSPNFSVGVGGRYWNIGTAGADADFPSGAQSINFRTELWGAFVQASYKFGDLRQNAHP